MGAEPAAFGKRGEVEGSTHHPPPCGLVSRSASIERLDGRPVAIGAGHAGEFMTVSYRFPGGPAPVTSGISTSERPDLVAGAIRGSLASTALVAVVELRRKPADDSACELARGIGPERVSHELVP